MHDRAVHAVEHLVEDPFARQQRADRHVPAGQRLGQEHHIGLDVPVIDGEKPAGPSHAGLDFVGDEQSAVFPAQIERAAQIAVIRDGDAFVLDRLDDESGDLARGQGPLKRPEIAEGDFEAFRQQRFETGAEILVAVQR